MLATAAAASTSQRDASTVMAATYTVEPVAAESPSTDKPNTSADKRDELRSALRYAQQLADSVYNSPIISSSVLAVLPNFVQKCNTRNLSWSVTSAEY